jgi:predicted dehydrogenase
MKFLIAGLGSIGRRHLKNLLSLGQNDIILYRTHHSSLPEDDLAGFPVETDLATALKRKPDAVIVSNPTSRHLDVAIPAARAGCHLLLEKPVSHTMDRVGILRDLVRQNNCGVLVGYQFRFHPGLLKLISWLRQGTIGRPLTARAHWGEYLPYWHPWEDYRQSYSAQSDLGGGVVLTLSHPLDYLLWMFGKAERVVGLTAKLGDLELDVEDTAEVIIEFAQGTLVSLHLDYNQRPKSHWLEIIGSQGSLRWDQVDGVAHLWRSSAKNEPTADEIEHFTSNSPLDQDKPLERNDLFMAEMKHFIDLVRGQATSRCSLDDGVLALELALTVYKSSVSQRPVDLISQPVGQ